MATEYKVASNLNLYGNDINKVQNITGKPNLVISGEGEVTVKGSVSNNDLKISSANGNSLSTITDASILTVTPVLTQTSADFKVQAEDNTEASNIKVGTAGVTLGKKTGNTIAVDDNGVSINTNIKTTVTSEEITISGGDNLTITAAASGSTIKANNLNADTSVKIGNFRMEWDKATGTLVFVGEE